MKFCLSVVAPLLALTCSGQWEVPVRLVLNGAAAEDRQVIGLADPLSADAAVSVNAARDNVTTFASVNGNSLLTGELVPAPQAYTAGMMVTIVPTLANDANAQVDLNGLGPQDIMKAGDLPLDSADLAPGVPVRLLHDGQRFHLIGTSYLPCPSGYHVGGREFCIEDSARADTNYYFASKICVDLDTRLCTFGEWVFACRHDPAFIGTVLDFEWVDSAANNTNGAKKVGNGNDGTIEGLDGIDCAHGGQAAANTGTARFRCCKHR